MFLLNMIEKIKRKKASGPEPFPIGAAGFWKV
jgi:hypothetical protein